MRFVAVALTVYAGMLLGVVFCLTIAPAANLPLVASVAVGGLGSGFLKILNILQNHRMSEKIDEDVTTTKQVKHLVNGGMEERIATAVAKALAERDAADAKAKMETLGGIASAANVDRPKGDGITGSVRT
jgi:hypothetical protein